MRGTVFILMLAAPLHGDNTAQIELGRHLFYDKRMSVNGAVSCATCHRQELAFTDGRALAVGATQHLHPRSSMSLANAGTTRLFNWADPRTRSLEEQALRPMLSENPVELGFGSIRSQFLGMIRTDAIYGPLFREAFPLDADPYTVPRIASALAAFERTLVSTNSPYDRFHRGDPAAISEAAKRGEILFFLDGGPSCFRCHAPPSFSDEREFHNTGLYNRTGEFSYPAPNRGLFEHTHRQSDVGKFKAPTLRNIAVTAPYMHDGSIATLEEAIDHYAAGGRTIAQGPWAGAGRENPNQDPLVHGFYLTPRNRSDLVEFLKSLTDRDFLTDPRFADPWAGDCLNESSC